MSEHRVVVEGGAVATVDAAGTEYAEGYVVVSGGRIAAVGAGPAPADPDAERIDATGCLVTPGLVNTHDHLYQWATRGLAQDAGLFDWLAALYPVWAGLDETTVAATSLAGLVALARSGATTSADHHYVFPAGSGDLLAAEAAAAGRVGLRLHLCRGSMDLGFSAGGLPPDRIVEDTDAALAGTEAAIERFHDPAPDAVLQVAVAPCSPFSASEKLMRGGAELARRHGVRLHTHLAETAEEDAYCRRRFGLTPARYADRLDWLGPDVWVAHGVRLDARSRELLARTGTAVAHCPSSNARLGSGIAPVRRLLDAGVTVGLGVDGAASNETGSLLAEVHQALLAARLRGGPGALGAREALWLATMGGAGCLGRAGELGSLEVGKLADLAVWRLDGFASGDIADPVAALVLGPPAPVARLLVGGRTVVVDGEVVGCPAAEADRELRAARGELLDRVARHGPSGG